MRKKLPLKCVVDTNIPVIANNKEFEDDGERLLPSPECVLKCVETVRRIKEEGHIYIDNGWRIIGEYLDNLDTTGQPGAGNAFLKWLLQNMSNPKKCTQVPIKENHENGFMEFPVDQRLVHFDLSDRKFVAVSNGHSEKPPILEGFDSKWWGYKDVLEELGIIVHFICEKEIEKKYHEKIG